MKKYTGQEWELFRNQAGRIQFNSICRSCERRCKHVGLSMMCYTLGKE